MNITKHSKIILQFGTFLCAGLLAATLSSCGSATVDSSHATSGMPKTSPAPAPTPAPVVALPTIRVKAGAEKEFKDSKGVVWKADTGFEDGMTIDRPDLKVKGTDTPEIYQSEHYSMKSWSTKAANGKYMLKLHFSEDYDGIRNENGRIFNYTIKDGDAANGTVVKDVKAFGPWKAAKAQFTAYVDSVPVEVTKGQISVVFTPVTENPQINAIELVSQ